MNKIEIEQPNRGSNANLRKRTEQNRCITSSGTQSHEISLASGLQVKMADGKKSSPDISIQQCEAKMKTPEEKIDKSTAVSLKLRYIDTNENTVLDTISVVNTTAFNNTGLIQNQKVDNNIRSEIDANTKSCQSEPENVTKIYKNQVTEKPKPQFIGKLPNSHNCEAIQTNSKVSSKQHCLDENYVDLSAEVEQSLINANTNTQSSQSGPKNTSKNNESQKTGDPIAESIRVLTNSSNCIAFYRNDADLSAEVEQRLINALNEIQKKVQSFIAEIDNFTELENSNKYHYIKESLRRLIRKLDNIFDDAGENENLRALRETIYQLTFSLFHELDKKVEENKIKIAEVEQSLINANTNTQSSQSDPKDASKNNESKKTGEPKAESIRELTNSNNCVAIQKNSKVESIPSVISEVSVETTKQDCLNENNADLSAKVEQSLINANTNTQSSQSEPKDTSKNNESQITGEPKAEYITELTNSNNCIAFYQNDADLTAEVEQRLINALNEIQKKVQSFVAEIDNFTELENSNKYHYIEESLRRLIIKLDNMFDDTGENENLRAFRKAIYQFTFLLFDELDKKVMENKIKIAEVTQSLINANTNTQSSQSEPKNTSKNNESQKTGEPKAESIRELTNSNNCIAFYQNDADLLAKVEQRLINALNEIQKKV